jgi:hypothetical protein
MMGDAALARMSIVAALLRGPRLSSPLKEQLEVGNLQVKIMLPYHATPGPLVWQLASRHFDDYNHSSITVSILTKRTSLI